MITSVRTKHCCGEESEYSGGIAAHTHDERYYTKTQIDQKFDDVETGEDNINNRLDQLDLQKITEKSNVTDRGLKLKNGTISTDMKHVVGATVKSVIEVSHNKPELGVNGIHITPQDTNSSISKTSIFTKLKDDLGNEKTIQLDMVIDHNGKSVSFNTPLAGEDAVADNQFVTKRQLGETLDNIIEYGDNA